MHFFTVRGGGSNCNIHIAVEYALILLNVINCNPSFLYFIKYTYVYTFLTIIFYLNGSRYNLPMLMYLTYKSFEKVDNFEKLHHIANNVANSIAEECQDLFEEFEKMTITLHYHHKNGACSYRKVSQSSHKVRHFTGRSMTLGLHFVPNRDQYPVTEI